MKTTRILAAALLACLLCGCNDGGDTLDIHVAADVADRLDDFAVTEITADLSVLPASERAALDELVLAGQAMHEAFRIQALPMAEEIEAALAAYAGDDAEAVRAYFDLNAGPWDRREHFEPFFGDWIHPDGANFYPLDLTAAERAQLEAGEDGLNSLYTMVRRDEAGDLTAIPYSVFFKPQFEVATTHMRRAAELTENASLRAYLTARAAAFETDDYFESDMVWMDLDGLIEVVLGPIETYEDGLFGYKAAFETFVTVADPGESERLAMFKGELPWLEAHLPLADEHKNPNRGTESPIKVVDEVYTAGDTRTAIQTIAFNLPNDEAVREAKGSKKVLLRNVMNAKFDQILTPIAEHLVVADQLPHLAQQSFFLHTLWHEMSHGLGPGRITLDGRDTEVRLELKDTYSTIEEAKADAMGPWCIFRMAEKGYFPESIYSEQAVTYLAGLFRSVRFGIGEAHGQANAIQFNYLLEKGVVIPEAGRFRIDVAAFPGAIEQLVADILLLQAEGDYTAAQAMIAKYGVMPTVLSDALTVLEDVTVDLRPVYPAENR
jgi:hypothetical protein